MVDSLGKRAFVGKEHTPQEVLAAQTVHRRVQAVHSQLAQVPVEEGIVVDHKIDVEDTVVAVGHTLGAGDYREAVVRRAAGVARVLVDTGNRVDG